MSRHVVVLDIGKTLSKASLWTPDGDLVERRSRTNEHVEGPGYVALDAKGIEQWLAGTLSDFARRASVGAIIPVAHGAAAAVVRNGRLHRPPVDYEHPLPVAERSRYLAQRDAFSETGSPALPDVLNLGAQLHLLEALDQAALPNDSMILLWPQYWAWVLSGVAASEVSSLGCHTDLWIPRTGELSPLAKRRGWARQLPALRHAGDCLGPITPAWAARCGLSPDVRVHCGVHDSNAALLAARSYPQLTEVDATVVSTGTWFVAMRTPNVPCDIARLPETRDCLVNVDIDGRPVPSARFMGGREIELLTGTDVGRIDVPADQPELIAALAEVLRAGTMLLPTFVPGCGPFPRGPGRWLRRPQDATLLRAAVALYAALVADVSLELIGARDHIVVEGRFAQARAFVQALAGLRSGARVYVANAGHDASFGALRLLDPRIAPRGALEPIAATTVALDAYRRTWRAAAAQPESVG